MRIEVGKEVCNVDFTLTCLYWLGRQEGVGGDAHSQDGTVKFIPTHAQSCYFPLLSWVFLESIHVRPIVKFFHIICFLYGLQESCCQRLKMTQWKHFIIAGSSFRWPR